MQQKKEGCGTEENTGESKIYNDYFIFTISGFDVHTVELIINGLLITFTFQQFDDFHVFAQKHSQEALQHTKICFLAEKVLSLPNQNVYICPVVPYQSLF